MPDIATLTKAVTTYRALKQLFLSGDLAEMIAESELKAARDALQKANIAVDTESQVWSAVNHLESAHRKCLSLYKGKHSFFNFAGQTNKIRYNARLDRWILYLMAVCYKFLGEKRLLESAVEEALKIEIFPRDEPDITVGALTIIWGIHLDRDIKKYEKKSDALPHLREEYFLSLNRSFS